MLFISGRTIGVETWGAGSSIVNGSWTDSYFRTIKDPENLKIRTDFFVFVVNDV